MMVIPQCMATLVFERPNFVSQDFCKRAISDALHSRFEPATITSEQGTHIASDIRSNDRVIRDDPDLARALWHNVQGLFPADVKGQSAVGLNTRFRVYRYGPGQFFDWHQDGAVTAPDGTTSQFTMMIYLNEGFDGGGTTFADVFSPQSFDDFTIAPSAGKALFFHHPIAHRGAPVISGEKYVLRSAVMFAKA